MVVQRYCLFSHILAALPYKICPLVYLYDFSLDLAGTLLIRWCHIYCIPSVLNNGRFLFEVV